MDANRKPKQLKLPFNRPPPPKAAGHDIELLETILRRLTRMESRLVHLMQHAGMTGDGRAPFSDDHAAPN